MKQIDEKDKPKLFALVGICVLVLGYAGYSFLGASTPSNTPAGAATPKPTVAGKPGVGGAPGTNGASSMTSPTGGTVVTEANPLTPATSLAAALATAPGTSGRDPFTPSGSAAPRQEKVVAFRGMPEVPKTPILPKPSVTTGGLGILLAQAKKLLPNLGGPSAATAPTGTEPMPVSAPPPPTLNVTGVVLADGNTTENVAILRNGGPRGDERRFVTVGDFVGNGYKVVAVHADGVDIEEKDGHRRLTVRIGKSGEDSRATN